MSLYIYTSHVNTYMDIDNNYSIQCVICNRREKEVICTNNFIDAVHEYNFLMSYNKIYCNYMKQYSLSNTTSLFFHYVISFVI
ncbi:hypothetical protein PUN28_001206 [Cardiocondyla obscurior]|uniref:Uncharacterized protein n=1 Tax=Cardiocondyla obscurior TaxID=286306 RepID=A0AAW2H4I2_9HYME